MQRRSSIKTGFVPRIEPLETRLLMAVFTVSITNDSGDGSLRQAILDANASAGTDLIAFDIPGAGPHSIQPLSMLPAISDPATIDGFSQPGASPGNLKIELRGSVGVDRGLVITAGSTLVRGLVINRFPEHAIRLETGDGNRIEGNFLGTDVTGTLPLGNMWGVMADINSTGNTIGGSTAEKRNIISGNSEAGVAFDITSGNVVEGNYIGTDISGLVAVSGLQKGVSIYNGSSYNRIGGVAPGAGNLISGNGQVGVFVSSGTRNVVQGNVIGLAADGSPLGNGQDGVYVNASNSIIGGIESGAANVIAFNSGYGVRVETATRIAIRQNSIFSNGRVGIELANGGNGNQTSPAVQLATSGNGQTAILLRLFSDPMTTFGIELFSSPVCDPSTLGEGETYLASASLTTNSIGRGRLMVVIDSEIPVGHVITATATSPNNNTSEFSKCRTVSADSAPIGQAYPATQMLPFAMSITHELSTPPPAVCREGQSAFTFPESVAVPSIKSPTTDAVLRSPRTRVSEIVFPDLGLLTSHVPSAERGVILHPFPFL
jgi:hypothetical protein